jgi:hypothetical protein
MKKAFLVLIMVSLAFSLTAQKPLATFFSEDGYKFWVIMDGKKMNDEPNYRVENIEMDNDWAKVKIIFENPALKPVEKVVQGVDVDGNISAVTWVIKETGKGKWKINASSWKPIDKQSAAEPVVTSQNGSVTDEKQTEIHRQVRTEKPVAHEQSEVAVTSGTNVFSMKVNIDDGIGSSNMDIAIGLPDMQVSDETVYSTGTTSETHKEVIEQPVRREKPEAVPGYNGRIGCENPMASERFATAKNSISSKSFEDSKLTVAKQVMNANCLLVSQVKQIMEVFDFESTRLEFAKAAYSRTYDIDNYYELNDVFDFESSIRELNNYIQK